MVTIPPKHVTSLLHLSILCAGFESPSYPSSPRCTPLVATPHPKQTAKIVSWKQLSKRQGRLSPSSTTCSVTSLLLSRKGWHLESTVPWAIWLLWSPCRSPLLSRFSLVIDLIISANGGLCCYGSLLLRWNPPLSVYSTRGGRTQGSPMFRNTCSRVAWPSGMPTPNPFSWK